MELFLVFSPIILGLICLFIKNRKFIIISIHICFVIEIILSIIAISSKTTSSINYQWLPSLGINFSLSLDPIGKLFVLLSTICGFIIFISTFKTHYKQLNRFWGLYMIAIGALIGVFIARDAMLFYFFWELVLIPIYFLCSLWGGKKRIQITLKFFVYTFVGSILMLIGIIYIAAHTADGGFSYQSFLNNQLNGHQQNIAFALIFIAFAIKIPLFPLHTWQPDIYEQAPTPITMLLSALLVKMGLFGIIFWIKPILPIGFSDHARFVIILAVIGSIYASLVAISQTNIKKLIAYSSIAHLALMTAAIFANNSIGLEGAILQLFNHSINIIGLWIIAYIVEHVFKSTDINNLGGIAKRFTNFSVFIMIMILANIALPLTNSFIGEFLIFNGLFQYNKWIAAVAIISIILTAIYSLNLVQKIILGEPGEKTKSVRLIFLSPQLMFCMIIITIFILLTGLYPSIITSLFQPYIQSIYPN